jgi:hypothetical protein
MALKADLRVRLSANQSGSNDFGGPDFAPVIDAALAFANGVGGNQADLLFVDERQVAASSNDDIDLYGALSSAFGATLNMAEIVALIIINAPKTKGLPANVSSLTIGGGSNPYLGFLGGTTPTIKNIGPGGVLLLAAPDSTGLGAVTASTADVLRVANGAGATANYQIGILARSS